MFSFKIFDISISRQTFSVEVATVWAGNWIGSALMVEYVGPGSFDYDILYSRELLNIIFDRE